MSALYILAREAAFRSCHMLTRISTSVVHKFFFSFLDALVDMKEEFVKLPANMTELKRIQKYYEVDGLPGACGSMDVVHIKWFNYPAGDYNWARGRRGTQRLVSSASPITIGKYLLFTGLSLELGTTRRSLKSIRM
jgi:hypothetical protein